VGARQAVLIKPLGQSLGAEVLGLKKSMLVEQSTSFRLREALYKHLLLVVRDLQLDFSGLIDLAKAFGKPELVWDTGSRHPESPYIQVMNSASQPGGGARSSSQFWHTDGSFRERPTLTTLLAIQQLPQEGGDTLFVDTRSAYDDLPKATQDSIGSLRLRYSYQYQLLGFQVKKYGTGNHETAEDYPDVLHPAARAHPVTGRGSLYLDQLCVASVEGKQETEGRELLDLLYAHTLIETRIYRHFWREGDLLIWDNPSLMHRRGPYHRGTRLLYRLSVAGPVPIGMLNGTRSSLALNTKV
jgi:taurine dioxygenase